MSTMCRESPPPWAEALAVSEAHYQEYLQHQRYVADLEAIGALDAPNLCTWCGASIPETAYLCGHCDKVRTDTDGAP